MGASNTINLGLLGAGYIARAHAIAFRSAAEIMDVPVQVRYHAVCSNIKEEAEAFAERFNCSRFYTDWQELIEDDKVDAVIIGTPPYLHFTQAMKALENGKHILCEKPVAMNAAECRRLYEKAKEKGLCHAVGLTYLANPGMFLVKELIEEKTLGNIYSFSGHFNEDHLSDPETPFHWHCDKDIAGPGTVTDLGYHIFGHLIYLFGMPQQALAYRQIKVDERQAPSGEMKPVTSDDMACGLLKYMDFSGMIQVSRVATGRDQFLQLEINGSKGSVVLDMEKMNEINLYLLDKDKSMEGYRRIPVGYDHKYYKHFCPAPGHGMNFNDFVTIQAGCFLAALCDKEKAPVADLRLGLQVQRIVDAMVYSSDNHCWVNSKDF